MVVWAIIGVRVKIVRLVLMVRVVVVSALERRQPPHLTFERGLRFKKRIFSRIFIGFEFLDFCMHNEPPLHAVHPNPKPVPNPNDASR